MREGNGQDAVEEVAERSERWLNAGWDRSGIERWLIPDKGDESGNMQCEFNDQIS
ncbi:hypothetical protein EGR_08253 [Echinococcus granulosus]|uniref:Uncharacterized protein n=1 Tax=Echinococcus granulosus TaxID=6210 RepID=W6U8U6_ECHGR|nr:hypothetical protein EGR_08253 [Echinococcus granulosus]EUB56901.1 hypothetical protein EGR_08253 [Echinococcus granulosus]